MSYDRLAKYYDAIYGYKDYVKESQFVDKVFKRFASFKVRSILDLGCGTGGHTIPLSKMGYDCVGIDLSSQMVKLAREKAAKARLNNAVFKVGAMQDFMGDMKFDSAISMSSAICFLTDYSDFKAALDKIRNVLKKGGILLFDFWNGVVVLNQFEPTKVKLCKDKKGELIRVSQTRLDYAKQLAIVDIDVRLLRNKVMVDEFKDRHTVRFYFLDEMRNYLEANGFKVLRLCPLSGLNKAVDVLKDWNVTIIAKRT